jgi:hypothetical protein
MGFIEFVLICVLVVLVAAAATWAIGYFAPSAPPIVVKLIWGVAVLIVFVILFRAVFGGHDVAIPHI